mmetsp:Transcript_27064/g.85054  ORF Transcript_27064/g.85054 Transcript_27064/m.85054 type:complete len:253 (-) Transcript_27064:1082-1840(-)
MVTQASLATHAKPMQRRRKRARSDLVGHLHDALGHRAVVGAAQALHVRDGAHGVRAGVPPRLRLILPRQVDLRRVLTQERGRLRLLARGLAFPQVRDLERAAPQLPLIPGVARVHVALLEVRGRLRARVGHRGQALGPHARDVARAPGAAARRAAEQHLRDAGAGELVLHAQQVDELRLLHANAAQAVDEAQRRVHERRHGHLVREDVVLVAPAHDADLGLARHEQAPARDHRPHTEALVLERQLHEFGRRK